MWHCKCLCIMATISGTIWLVLLRCAAGVLLCCRPTSEAAGRLIRRWIGIANSSICSRVVAMHPNLLMQSLPLLQTDYAKLQEAYQALKRQSVAQQRPGPSAVPPAAAPAPPSDSFLKLQVRHCGLWPAVSADWVTTV